MGYHRCYKTSQQAPPKKKKVAKMDTGLKGKTAVVTGTAQVISREIAAVCGGTERLINSTKTVHQNHM